MPMNWQAIVLDIAAVVLIAAGRLVSRGAERARHSDQRGKAFPAFYWLFTESSGVRSDIRRITASGAASPF